MYKRLISETIIYGIGAVLPRVITFLLNPFYFEHINVAEFAKFTNLYALISFVNILLTFGFETAFFRFAKDKSETQKVFNTSFWFLFFNAFVFILLILVLREPIAQLLNYEENPEYITWFGWIAFFDTLCVIPYAWLRFRNKAVAYSAIRVGQITIQTLAVMLLFLVIPYSVSASFGLNEKVAFPFFSNLIGSLAGILMLLPIGLKLKIQFDYGLFKKMFRFAYPIMIAGFAFMVNENFDKVVQRFIISEVEAGAYGGCYKLAVLMTLFVTAYRMGVEPYLFKQMEANDAKIKYARITEYFSIVASIIALGIITNLSWLKNLIITDPDYLLAIDIVPVIVISNLFFGIYYNLSTWYKVTDNTKIGSYISWAGAGITIILNLALVPFLGFMVSAWATLVAYAVMMVISYIIGQKNYHIPYRKRKILFYLALVIIFSMISYLGFSQNLWVGNSLFFIFLSLIFFIEKQTIKNLL